MNADNASGDSYYEEINSACERFEAEWQVGREPRIEDYLAEVPEPARPELVRELLKLEICYLRERGETVPDDYKSRFPEHASLIDTLLAVHSATEQPGELSYAGRYRLEDLIGRGGMGEVYRAHDPDFRRPLAVKILKEEFKDRPEMVARFLEEAQITGQLQHPGVPPVHEIGRLPDGRPFLAMKLIEGRTLADHLAERKDPADGLPRFLTNFEQICQTVAYAHSRRVIHRDLKPLNIMVGAFGEVQVMDWGLAKARTSAAADRKGTDDSQPNTLHTLRADTVVGPTMPGAVLGTLAYMPPEQARGEIDKIDERSDVFSLGATLCEILTGEPPYREPSQEKRWEQARNADLDDAFSQLDACGADAELIALAKSCLTAEMGLRPAHAGAVSDAVAKYEADLQERIRKAELDRAAAQVKFAEERKRRKLTLALASSGLAVLLIAAVGGLWVQQIEAGRRADKARNETEQRQMVEAAIKSGAGLLKEARWKEAQAVLDQARERLGESGPVDLFEGIQQAQDSLALATRLDSIRQKRSAWVGDRFDDTTADRDYAAAFREAGLGEATEDAEVVAGRVRNSAISEQLQAALDDWIVVAANSKRRAWLLQVGRLAEPDAWRDRIRDLNVRRNPSTFQALANELLSKEAILAELKPQLLAALGNELAFDEGNPIPFLLAAQPYHPTDFWLNLQLGNAMLKVQKSDEAIGYFRAALAVQPESIAARNNLGNALSNKKQWDEAITQFRIAIEIEPKFVRAHTNLGIALGKKERFNEAISHLQRAIEFHSKNPRAYTALGIIMAKQGQFDKAIGHYQKALELDPAFAEAFNNLGNALREMKQLDKAIEAQRTAIKINPRLAAAHNDLGVALKDKNELDEAILEHRKAIEIDPTLAVPHNGLALALESQNKLDEAIQELRKAIEIDPKYVIAHYNLGHFLRSANRPKEGIQHYRTIIEINPKWAPAYCSLGNALLDDMKQLYDAIPEYDKAIKLDPKYPAAHYGMGNALSAKNDLDGAIQEYSIATKLDPDYTAAHYNLGNALSAKKNLDGAILEYRAAIKLDPKHTAAHYNLGNALSAKKDLDGAILEYRTAIQLDPKRANAHCNLGHALRKMGKFTEALAALKRGHEIGSQRKDWGYRSAQWVRQCERLVELDSKLPAILKGDTQPASAAERLELASLCQLSCKRLHAAAARFCDEAFTAEPKLAEDLRQHHRYDAACSASLAAAGQAADAANLNDKERIRLRDQALAWLRADLDAWTRLADDSKEHARVRQTLQQWQQDSDLARLRDPAAVAQLPEDEREACKKLWTDVTALRKKVEAK